MTRPGGCNGLKIGNTDYSLEHLSPFISHTRARVVVIDVFAPMCHFDSHEDTNPYVIRVKIRVKIPILQIGKVSYK